MSKSALLVIDLQNEYLPTGKLPLVNIEQAAANAVKVIAKARQQGTQVIHVQHIADAESPIFEPSSNGIEFQDTVKPQEDESVIIKNHINAFLNTNLKEILDSNQVTELVVIGAMSHMCVDAAFIAKALGNIAKAKGMAQLSRDTGLGRESLYKALSGDVNPSFDTVIKVVKALNLRLAI